MCLTDVRNVAFFSVARIVSIDAHHTLFIVSYGTVVMKEWKLIFDVWVA